MPLYVLDTDHISLFQRGHAEVVGRVNRTSADEIAVSIISYEEQLRGRLDIVRKSSDARHLVIAYLRLREMHELFCAIHILDFDASGSRIYEQLRRQHRQLGAMDLRIAATTLAHSGTLVTRNTPDFARIANLPLEDWSIV